MFKDTIDVFCFGTENMTSSSSIVFNFQHSYLLGKKDKRRFMKILLISVAFVFILWCKREKKHVSVRMNKDLWVCTSTEGNALK